MPGEFDFSLPVPQGGVQDPRRIVRPRARAALGLVLILGLAAACSRPPAEPPAVEEGIRKTFDRGPVSVTVSVDRSELTIAERLRLTIECLADEAYEADLPRFGEKLEPFGIVDYDTAQPELVAGERVRTARTYILEPFLSGEYTIPAMTIPFRRKDGAKDKAYEVETEPIDVTVSSLLPENLDELTINDVTDPVGFPRSPAAAIWTGALAVVALAVGFMLWILGRRRRRARFAAARHLPPHELALRDLQALVSEKLAERGEIKTFYQRISNILRVYIERRFGVRAPEQTTQEFLATIGESRDFPDEYRSLLDAFLRHCDLVKFAEFQPATEDIQKTFESCKSFILGTKETPAETEGGLKKLEY